MYNMSYEEYDYTEDSIELTGEVFDTDYDEVGFEPIEVDDSDEDMAEKLDY